MPIETTAYLTSPQNPRIKQLVRLQDAKERRQTGLFIAEGLREASRAFEAGLHARELFVCPDYLGRGWQETLGGEASQTFTVTPHVMRKIAYRENPEGLLAVFEQPRWSWQRLASRASIRDEPELWLLAVGTQKPGNLGAMARSADAAGVTGIIIADPHIDAFNPNAIRASTAAVFSLPMLAANRSEILRWLDDRQTPLFAAVAQNAAPYTDVDLTGPAALVVGPEDQGLPADWLDAIEKHPRGQMITIPTHGRIVDSLNASVAAGILMFEAVRQRRAAGGGPSGR